MRAKNRENSRRTGPPKLYPERTLLALTAGTLKSIDAVLAKDETRMGFIRAVVEREIKRREKRG